jgi:uroporphyrinogen-III synthase
MLAAPAGRVAALAPALRALGLRVLEAPVVETAPPENEGALDAALGQAPYDWVIFTSVRGVEAVAQRCLALDLRPDAVALRVAAVGPATAAAARSEGFPASATPAEFVTDAIPEVLGDIRGARVLLARADLATPALEQALASRGANVTRVAAYRTLRSTSRVAPADAAAADGVLFTSGSAVRFLAQALGDLPMQELTRRATAFCIGPVTAAEATGAGFASVRIAEPHTGDGLLALLRAEVNSVA